MRRYTTDVPLCRCNSEPVQVCAMIAVTVVPFPYCFLYLNTRSVIFRFPLHCVCLNSRNSLFFCRSCTCILCVLWEVTLRDGCWGRGCQSAGHSSIGRGTKPSCISPICVEYSRTPLLNCTISHSDVKNVASGSCWLIVNAQDGYTKWPITPFQINRHGAKQQLE